MEDKDIIEIIENDKELNSTVEMIAMLNVIIQSMIIHGWFTEEEFNKTTKEAKNNLMQYGISDVKKKWKDN